MHNYYKGKYKLNIKYVYFKPDMVYTISHQDIYFYIKGGLCNVGNWEKKTASIGTGPQEKKGNGCGAQRNFQDIQRNSRQRLKLPGNERAHR